MILYILLYSPDRNLKGLEDSRKSISVTFHAIVPKPLWDWDGTSCMHMRFDHKDLGKWHQNVGEFKEIRYMPIHTYVLAYYSSFLFFRSQDDYCEMTCTLPIQAELLKKPLQYKYVIFSPRMKEKNDCYEFLYSFADGENKDLNRYLYIGDLHHHGGKCDTFKLLIYSLVVLIDRKLQSV